MDGMELHRRRGAPNGNKNRLKHGRYSSAAIAQRKLVRETVRSAQKALLLAKLELPVAPAERHVDKSR